VPLLRTRWAAIGAAVAVTLGAGGLAGVRAETPGAVFVPITPERVVDSRSSVGLNGPLVGGRSAQVTVTGTVPVVQPDGTAASKIVVPVGATAITANVTAVGPSSTGFVSVRPGTATGVPSTSNINIGTVGGAHPNAVTVQLPVGGSRDGTIDLYYFADRTGATTNVLVDVVGYYTAGAGVPGPAGPTGPAGAKGPAGPAGARGLSAWDTIPSGRTIVGEFAYDTHQAGNTVTDEILVPFGAIAPTALTDTDVNFGTVGFADSTATCSGTPAAPTAPPGTVCIYAHSSDGIDRSNSLGFAAQLLRDRGFVVAITPAGVADADAYLFGTWAYTAP
jgi:hypothetical protein